MTVEQKTLHERIAALTDATLVTSAERNLIFLRPEPDEEECVCREKVGLTVGELKVKAVIDGATLTEDEVDILLCGAGWDSIKPRPVSYFMWRSLLLNDEYQLACQVQNFLATDYDAQVSHAVSLRTRAFDAIKKDRSEARKEERAKAQSARLRAAQPQWVRHMFEATLPQWGFVIFRTAYSEDTDFKWQCFRTIHNRTKTEHLCKSWRRAGSLGQTNRPLLVSDQSLDGANLDLLRQRFRTMREGNEISESIASDCFLVIDEGVLKDSIVLSQTQYQAKPVGDQNPWQYTLFFKAVDPDYDSANVVSAEEDASGYEGYITIPLPKIFDWLYYSFLTTSEHWKTRYKTVEGGAAELINPLSPYPAYRPGTEPASSLETELPLRQS